MSFSAADHGFMARALRLAERGLYTTTPNPRVGCVIVKDARIVGESWHQRAGEAHAEVGAIAAAGAAAREATVYVNLEPCSHHGRTPPCADALIAAGVGRVVAAMRDPNPLVAGTGLERLRAAGVTAECGLLEAAAVELNAGFVARMSRGRPWLRLKVAASLDGRTALANGDSRWITGAAARRDGHHWRARACAILSGSGTLRADDPSLTVREVATTRQPLRVVADSGFSLSLQAKALQDGNLLVAGATDHAARRAALHAAGAETVLLPGADGRVDLSALLAELARRGCNEVHAEGGATLNGALLEAGLVDEILIYLAPTLLGASARGMFGLAPLADLAGRHDLVITDLRRIGTDIRVLARPAPAA